MDKSYSQSRKLLMFRITQEKLKSVYQTTFKKVLGHQDNDHITSEKKLVILFIYIYRTFNK